MVLVVVEVMFESNFEVVGLDSYPQTYLQEVQYVFGCSIPHHR